MIARVTMLRGSPVRARIAIAMNVGRSSSNVDTSREDHGRGYGIGLAYARDMIRPL
jgi:hypothetical protein